MKVPGYPLLAETMADHPAMMMFRKFSNLNVKSILYYQAELARLDQQLSKMERRDWESWKEAQSGLHIDFWTLTHPCSDANGPPQPDQPPEDAASGMGASISPLQNGNLSTQWDVICRIRVVLEEYYQALHRQVQLEDTYQAPHRKDLEQLRIWHEDGRLGQSFLEGNHEDVWDETKGITEEHFVRVTDTGDSLSNRLASLLTVGPSWFDDLCGRVSRVFTKKRAPATDVEMNTPSAEPQFTAGPEATTSSNADSAPEGSDTSITDNDDDDDDDEEETTTTTDLVKSLTSTQYRTVIYSVLTVLSSTLPVVPIVVLYAVKSQPVRVALVFVFTIILAGVITFGLNMKAEKVIAITTAFAAVQVVFIATNTTPSDTSTSIAHP